MQRRSGSVYSSPCLEDWKLTQQMTTGEFFSLSLSYMFLDADHQWHERLLVPGFWLQWGICGEQALTVDIQEAL